MTSFGTVLIVSIIVLTLLAYTLLNGGHRSLTRTWFNSLLVFFAAFTLGGITLFLLEIILKT